MMRYGKSKVNIKALLPQKEEFQLQLQNRFQVLSEEGEEDAQEMAGKITKSVQESALDAAAGKQNRRTKSSKARQKIC